MRFLLIKVLPVYIFSSAIVFADDLNIKNIDHDMVVVPAGSFKMGCNQYGPMHGAPEHRVFLDSFLIDKFEVNNNHYEKIVPEHDLRRSKFSKCDNCPVTNISWYAAADYCYLIGKTLPSEAQWEKAAGNGDGCSFPWGYGYDPNKNQAHGDSEFHDSTKPVGSYPPNKNGIYDMAGNVWEWVSDWMDPSYKNMQPFNPKGPNHGLMKVRRGGSHKDSIIAMTVGYRDWSHPSSRSFTDIGFRCALNITRDIRDGIAGKNRLYQ